MIQFSMSTGFVYSRLNVKTVIDIRQFSLASARSLNVSTVKLSETFLFQAIHFSQTIQFSISMQLILFKP